MSRRYSRHIILEEIGEIGQQKIQNARILVIGAGGLGSPVLQYLTAAGVGTLGIIDQDVVDISNLQRQILFGKSSLGQNKALAAKQRLQDLNEEVTYHTYPFRLTNQNAVEIISQYDIVVDGTDNFASRYLINDACVILGKPLVYGSIFKFEGQVSVFNFHNGPTYRCLFPVPPEPNTVPSCSEIGVLGVLPGIIGTLQANEALKIVLNLGEVCSGKLLTINALTLENQIWEIEPDHLEIEKLKSEISLSEVDYKGLCGITKSDIEVLFSEIEELDHYTWVDVRDKDELPKLKLPNRINIPLGKLKQLLHLIPSEKPIVFLCQKGTRSKKAVELFKQELKTSTDAFSLFGGVIELPASLYE